MATLAAVRVRPGRRGGAGGCRWRRHRADEFRTGLSPAPSTTQAPPPPPPRSSSIAKPPPAPPPPPPTPEAPPQNIVTVTSERRRRPRRPSPWNGRRRRRTPRPSPRPSRRPRRRRRRRHADHHADDHHGDHHHDHGTRDDDQLHHVLPLVPVPIPIQVPYTPTPQYQQPPLYQQPPVYPQPPLYPHNPSSRTERFQGGSKVTAAIQQITDHTGHDLRMEQTNSRFNRILVKLLGIMGLAAFAAMAVIGISYSSGSFRIRYGTGRFGRCAGEHDICSALGHRSNDGATATWTHLSRRSQRTKPFPSSRRVVEVWCRLAEQCCFRQQSVTRRPDQASARPGFEDGGMRRRAPDRRSRAVGSSVEQTSVAQGQRV